MARRRDRVVQEERDPECVCWPCPACADERLMEVLCPCFEAGVQVGKEVGIAVA